jgi:xylan 1,4-beta-xylosidase
MRLALAAALLATSIASSATSGKRTYINPIDLDYRYNWEQINEGISYRTGADPAIVRHKGAYYMVQTLADGYWRSLNLVQWTFIKPSMWPMRSVVAPAVLSDGERLYIIPSRMEGGVILVSDAPETGKLDYLTRRSPELPDAVKSGVEDYIKPGQIAPGPWDPGLFKDDDGRWYLYWGSSNVFPLYGIELDPEKRLSYVGKATELFRLDPTRHGWERFGQDHSGGLPDGTRITPFMEGAWMTKVNGRYYLQYGAPGTEHNVYANGSYVGSSPLGPFTYPAWNPVAYKPGGFVEGAGHGSTFADEHGNWWNTGTPWLGYNWTFERRIAMFPTKFEADGQMWASTRFGDFPHWIPDGKVEDPASLFTGWMLLSYKKRAVAFSTLAGFPADRITDENPRTFWVAGANRAGEMLTLDLGVAKTVRALQVNFADYNSGRFADAPDIYTDFLIEASVDGRRWRKIAETDAPQRDRPNAYLALSRPTRIRYIRYVHRHVGAANLAIADIRVFGTADGKAPPAPASIMATLDQDQRNATISWQPMPGVTGYNVRWGVRPDRLTFTYQVFADEVAAAGRSQQAIRSLNLGQHYWASVEAFNESGVSPIGEVKPIR